MYLIKTEINQLFTCLAVNMVILKEIIISSQLQQSIILRVMVTSVMFHRIEEMTCSLIKMLGTLT